MFFGFSRRIRLRNTKYKGKIKKVSKKKINPEAEE